MCGKRKMDSTEHIFSDLKILKFIYINLYLTGRFMFKFLSGDVPRVFNEFFHCNNAVHNYTTKWISACSSGEK